jgi:hypothetical protein
MNRDLLVTAENTKRAVQEERLRLKCLVFALKENKKRNLKQEIALSVRNWPDSDDRISALNVGSLECNGRADNALAGRYLSFLICRSR